jgi:hypothetical protein
MIRATQKDKIFSNWFPVLPNTPSTLIYLRTTSTESFFYNNFISFVFRMSVISCAAPGNGTRLLIDHRSDCSTLYHLKDTRLLMQRVMRFETRALFRIMTASQ